VDNRKKTNEAGMDIHRYASAGDIAGVLSEIAQGVSVDCRDERDRTPLAIAARSPNANEETLRVLIEKGADVNAVVDESKHTPIGYAACSGDQGKVQVLLDAGASLNYVTASGYTVLIDTIYALNSEPQLLPMLEYLLDKGAELECETQYGETPQSVASFFGRFDAVKLLLDRGADPVHLQWTPLMRAVALGTAEDVKKLLDDGCGLSERLRDRSGRTAWLLAAFVGDVDKAKLLFAEGANLQERGRNGLTALMYCAQRGSQEMLDWLLEVGADMEAVDESEDTALIHASADGSTDCMHSLLAAGANPNHTNTYGDTAISQASNIECIRALVSVGQDMADISTEMRRKLTGLQGDSHLGVTKAEYKTGKDRQFGTTNPDLMDIPFWREMVRSGVSACHARNQFADEERFSSPVWCFSRFGTSFTELPDGRFVQIAGEHEDHYDPDFCIYNEVIVHDRPGEFRIFGYPKDVFPPTDFHSATYFDGFIYIVGNLGYHGARKFGTTPVFRLNCTTWQIEPVTTSGDMPGWIYEHKCRLSGSELIIRSGKIAVEIEGKEKHLENDKEFRLNLSTRVWRRV
jgi:ankyrin repeat protein